MSGTRKILCMVVSAGLAAGCARKPAAIQVSPSPVKIYGLQRVQRLTGRVVDKKGRAVPSGSLKWSSSKGDVVTVDQAGKLQSKGEGRAIVTASFEKLRLEVPVEVVDVKSIEIAPASAHLVGPVGTVIALSATVKNSRDKAVSRAISWSSSKPTIATVSREGLVTSVSPGTTAILARIGDVQGVSEVFVVVGEITRVEIHPTTALVRVGDTQRFEVIAYGTDGKAYEGSAAVFASSDPAVATVDGAGVASGNAAGTATIKASVASVSTEATLLVN